MEGLFGIGEKLLIDFMTRYQITRVTRARKALRIFVSRKNDTNRCAFLSLSLFSNTIMTRDERDNGLRLNEENQQFLFL